MKKGEADDLLGKTGLIKGRVVTENMRRTAIDAIKKYDIVLVHVEATDEAGHAGKADIKKNALEEISQYTGEDDQNRIRSTSEAEIAKETLDKVSKMII